MKKMEYAMTARISFLAFAVIMAFCVVNVDAVTCNGTGNIVNSTTISDGCTLNSAGTYYFSGQTFQLNGSKSGVINIVGNNILIEGNSSTLIGNRSSNTYAIVSSYRNNITIKNLNFKNYQKSIYWNSASGGSQNNSVINSTFFNDSLYSIHIQEGTGFLIENNTFNYSADSSVFIHSKSYRNIVKNNLFYDSNKAVHITSNSWYNNVSLNNVFRTSGSSPIQLRASSNSTENYFKNNNLYNSSNEGVRFEGRNYLQNNLIDNSNLYSIYLSSGNGSLIENNTVNGNKSVNSRNIRIDASNGIIINLNIFRFTHNSIWSDSLTYDVNITNNTIRDGDVGLSLAGNNFLVMDNQIVNMTANYDGYDVGANNLNISNSQFLRNNLSELATAGWLFRLANNITLINNSYSFIPFSQRVNYSARDYYDFPCAIKIVELFKTYLGGGFESGGTNISYISTFASNNFTISEETFDLNTQCFLQLEGASNINHDLNNYWYQSYQSPTILVNKTELYLSNNFDNITGYDLNLYTSYKQGYNGKYYSNISIFKDYQYFLNTNSSFQITNIFNKTSSLIYTSNGSLPCGSTLVTGNCNVTLQPNNYSYVLDNFNLTEGVTRSFSPLSITSVSNEAYRIVYTLDSTLSSSVSNILLVPSSQACPVDVKVGGTSQTFSCNGDDLSTVTITDYGANQFELELLYSTATDDTCVNTMGAASKLFKGLGLFFIFAILGGAVVWLFVTYGGGEFDWFSLVLSAVLALLIAFFFTIVLSINVFEGATC